MTKEQLESIVALLSSQQMAITHLSLMVAELTSADASDVAKSFRVKGAELSTKNNGAIAELIFNQIARGIEAGNSVLKEELKKEITDLLH